MCIYYNLFIQAAVGHWNLLNASQVNRDLLRLNYLTIYITVTVQVNKYYIFLTIGHFIILVLTSYVNVLCLST